MKEQVDKIVYDFKQSLGQQTFYVFDLLKKQTDENVAQQLVLEELGRMIKQFDGKVSDPAPSLQKLKEELEQEIIQENNNGNITRVMEIEDDLSALRRTESLIGRIEH